MTKSKLLLLCCGASILVANSRMVAADEAETPKIKIREAAPENVLAKSILEADWRKETCLSQEIHFKLLRQPLKVLLDEVKAQTKVDLLLPETVNGGEQLLTAFSKAMPVSQVMDNLGRMYGWNWKKIGDNQFQARVLALSPFELNMMKFGNIDAWRQREYSMSGEKRRDLALRIVEQAGLDQLKSGGVPLRELDDGLRDELMNSMMAQYAAEFVDKENQAGLLNPSRSTLQIRFIKVKSSIRKIKENNKSETQTVANLYLTNATGLNIGFVGAFRVPEDKAVAIDAEIESRLAKTGQ